MLHTYVLLEGGVWGVYAVAVHINCGVVIIIVDAMKWPHPVQVLYEENCYELPHPFYEVISRSVL